MGWSLTVVLLGLLVPVLCEVTLDLSTDAPAVLDAPITFVATLGHVDEEEHPGPFFYQWRDHMSPSHFIEKETSNHSMSLTLTYDSEEYIAGQYVMSVAVYELEETFFIKTRVKLAEAQVSFNVTKTLNGRLVLKQNNTTKDQYVSSLQTAYVDCEIYDPENYLKKSVLKYYWFINDYNTGIGNRTYSQKFPVGTTHVEVLVLATPKKSNTKQHYSSLIANKEHLSMRLAQALNSTTKEGDDQFTVGIFQTKVISVTPIQNTSVAGKRSFKQGLLMELDVTCDGSGPWRYCWNIEDANYNITGDETCKDGITVVQSCEFPIIWYFREVATSSVLVIIENAVSTNASKWLIDVYASDRKGNSSMYVVIPVISSCIIVISVLLGLCFYYTGQRRPVETADFDFSIVEEELQYKTFWERLRDAMLNSFGSSSDDISNISSVSSRSVQPPVGIHYGSIT